jgi:hypothetical protein
MDVLTFGMKAVAVAIAINGKGTPRDHEAQSIIEQLTQL